MCFHSVFPNFCFDFFIMGCTDTRFIHIAGGKLKKDHALFYIIRNVGVSYSIS